MQLAANKPINPTSTRCAHFVGLSGRYMPIRRIMLNRILDKIAILREHEVYYQQVHGVKYIMQGLDYHFKNYMRLLSEDDDIHWFHEVVAYLNRIGQIYYFLKSDFIAAQDSEAPALKRVIPFRMKYSAHRSIDAPRRDDLPLMMDISIPNMYYTKPSVINPDVNSKAIALPKQNSDGEREPYALFIDDEHRSILTEIDSALLRKISELGI